MSIKCAVGYIDVNVKKSLCHGVPTIYKIYKEFNQCQSQ